MELKDFHYYEKYTVVYLDLIGGIDYSGIPANIREHFLRIGVTKVRVWRCFACKDSPRFFTKLNEKPDYSLLPKDCKRDAKEYSPQEGELNE